MRIRQGVFGMDKLIITVAPVGNFQLKEVNPAVPYSPAEIADSVYDCWNEGASIAHIHCRDESGIPTSDPEVFRQVDERIRARKCNIILDHSTTGNPFLQAQATIDDGMRSIEDTNPEMASLSMGVGVTLYEGQAKIMPRDRYWIERQAKIMMRRGIRPNLEVYNLPMIELVQDFVDKGLLAKPCWISLVMGDHRLNQNATRYSPRALMYHIGAMPADSIFSIVAVDDDQLPATTLSILLGGHCRVGFEDNLYYRKGQLAESNAQLVARTVRIGRELGREPATPDEARQILGIAKLERKEVK